MTSSLIIFVLFVAVAGAAVVFQGSCSDKDVLCEQLCLTLSPETYECGCWNDHLLLADGLSCRLNTTHIDVSYTRAPSGGRPRPSKISQRKGKKRVQEREEQSPSSLRFNGHTFAEFPARENAYLETNVTIEFRFAELRDGLLFFAGEFQGDDYISVALIGPNVMLRYDCGEGAVEDLYRGPFAENAWHTLTVHRKYCNKADIRMDTRPVMEDEQEQFKFYKGITMDEGVFIGGAPQGKIEFFDSKTGTDQGFRGCIRRVVINGEVFLGHDVNKAINKDKLELCHAEPSYEHVRIVVPGRPNYRGSDEVSQELKDDVGTTTRAATTTTEKPTTTAATVPSGTVMKIVEFSGNGFVVVPGPRDANEYIEMVIHLKPSLPDGLLVYWVEGHKHLAVYLEQGFLNVHVNMGADSAIVRSENVLSLDAWHKAELWRSGKGILLKVDHQRWIETELVSLGSSLHSDGETFIGGTDRHLPAHLQHLEGFHGCVKRVVINAHPVHFHSTARSVAVKECGSDPCSTAACDGHCVSRLDQHVCMCEWPKSGDKCEINNLSAQQLEAMRFQGHSYLEFDDEAHMQYITGDRVDLTIDMRLANYTANNEWGGNGEQVLFYAHDHSQSNAGDFFKVSITKDRCVRVSLDLGAGPSVLTHPESLDVGRWTSVRIVRERRRLTLSLNGAAPITTQSAEGSEQLNVYKAFYIGGYSSPDWHSSGLRGCVASIRLGDTIITQPTQARHAVNIQQCE